MKQATKIKGTIYKATTPSGKSYIGQTIKKFEYRKSEHISTANSKGGCRLFRNAVRKYGDRIEWLVVEEVVGTKKEMIKKLNKLEKHYIKKYDTLAPNGYNLTTGGYNFTHNKETRLKISKAKKGQHSGSKHPMYGKKHTTEARRKMSENNASHRPEVRKKMSDARKGIKHSYETRKKMSENCWRRGIKDPKLSERMKKRVGKKNPMFGRKGDKHHNSKPVICITTGEWFSCAREATRETGVDFRCISNCITGKRKSAGKLPDGTKLVWTHAN